MSSIRRPLVVPLFTARQACSREGWTSVIFSKSCCRDVVRPLRHFTSTPRPRRPKSDDAPTDEASPSATHPPSSSTPPPSSPPPSQYTQFPGFKPRTVYEPPTGVLRTYFIGHHRSALDNMRRILATVGLVIECRDLRVPMTSWNPLLESSLMGTGVATEHEGSAGSGSGSARSLPGLSGPVRAAGRNPLLPSSAETNRSRIIIYTKRDLVVDGKGGAKSSLSPTPADLRRLTDFHARNADTVLFMGQPEAPSSSSSSSSSSSPHSKVSRREANKLLAAVREVARRHGEQSLTGLRALVVGMPNAGKSTLLNKLRASGMTDANRRNKAAATGAQPGVTRKIGTPVRVLDDAEDNAGNNGAGVLVIDTPGVFFPYVSNAESMLKLALVGCVREGLVPPVALADYLLFQLNKRDPALYMTMFGLAEPTEDVHVLLDAVGRRIGKLSKGGVPDHDAAAQHLITAWRRGRLGAFCLDELDEASLAAAQELARQGPPVSISQARKRQKEDRKARALARHNGDVGSGSTASV